MPWHWRTDEETAFTTLKQAFAEALVLALYDPNRATEVEVDASNFATGGVLLQKDDDGLWHLVAYRSETMNMSEHNYKIYDKEFMVIVQALEDWHYYLEGLPEFTVISDYKNLEYWTKAHNLTRQQARWSLWLSRFNLQITYYPGKFIGKSDALTCSASTKVFDANDNRDQIVLVPQQLHQIVITVITGPNPLEERIQESSEKEAEVVAALKKMKKTGPQEDEEDRPSQARQWSSRVGGTRWIGVLLREALYTQ